MGDIQLDQNMVIENIWRVLHILQQENNNMGQVFERLQVRALQNPRGTVNQQVL